MRFPILAVSALLGVAPLQGASLLSFLHTATSANTAGVNDQLTRLDHPLITDNPDARLLVTQNWNPASIVGVYNDHNIGVVFYETYPSGGDWYIINEDGDAIPEGASFNVLIAGPDSLSFVHHTTDGNSSGRATFVNPIDPDCLLCPPGTRLLFTHTFTALGIPGSSFDYHATVLFSSPGFAIVTESTVPGYLLPMPTGVFFNVLVAESPSVASSPGSSFVHAATIGTVSSNYTVLSHPELDGNQRALVFVARAGPVLFDSPHELGVWYTPYSKWSIFFQDEDPMLVDSLYNVYIPPLMSDGFESGDLSWWSSSQGSTP